jgi:hypothetical protein
MCSIGGSIQPKDLSIGFTCDKKWNSKKKIN